MTVYKYFLRISLKYKWAMIAYVTLFFVLSIINSTSRPQSPSSFKETKLDISIIDNSNSNLSRSLIDYLAAKNNIVDPPKDLEDGKELIFLEIADAVIIIPEDFEEKVINKEKAIEVYRDDRKIESYQIQHQINKFLSFVNATNDNGDFDLDTVNLALKEKAEVKILGASNGNENIKEWFLYYFNFTSYVIIAVYIVLIGMVMSDFSEANIENRRKVSSKRNIDFNKEIYLGQFSLAAIVTSIFILGSIILKGKYIGEVQFGKYVINTIIFSFAILSLTYLINNITNNRFIKNGISTVLSLGTSFISGVMIPQELLGQKVVSISKFFPTYYFVKINRTDISSLLDVKYEILMQLLFAMAFLLTGLYFSRIKKRV